MWVRKLIWLNRTWMICDVHRQVSYGSQCEVCLVKFPWWHAWRTSPVNSSSCIICPVPLVNSPILPDEHVHCTTCGLVVTPKNVVFWLHLDWNLITAVMQMWDTQFLMCPYHKVIVIASQSLDTTVRWGPRKLCIGPIWVTRTSRIRPHVRLSVLNCSTGQLSTTHKLVKIYLTTSFNIYQW